MPFNSCRPASPNSRPDRAVMSFTVDAACGRAPGRHRETPTGGRNAGTRSSTPLNPSDSTLARVRPGSPLTCGEIGVRHDCLRDGLPVDSPNAVPGTFEPEQPTPGDLGDECPCVWERE